MLALFFEYGKGESESVPRGTAKKGFDITPQMLSAFGGRNRQVCRQSNLPADMRRRLEEFQSTEAYKNWRRKVNPKG